jgi:hypothetical protein
MRRMAGCSAIKSASPAPTCLLPGARIWRRSLRIGIGLLPGRVEQADALQAHVQPRGVHHHEHRVQALAGLAHDPGSGFVKAHHAGGAAVQTHFFFDALAVHPRFCEPSS